MIILLHVMSITPRSSSGDEVVVLPSSDAAALHIMIHASSGTLPEAVETKVRANFYQKTFRLLVFLVSTLSSRDSVVPGGPSNDAGSSLFFLRRQARNRHAAGEGFIRS